MISGFLSLARQSLLCLLLAISGGAMAQTPVDGTPYGKTITLGALPYLACDNSVWTAVYLGSISQGFWEHTNINDARQRYTSEYIKFLNSDGSCMLAEFDFQTVAGGMYFILKRPGTDENRRTQWLDVKRPGTISSWDAVQLNPVWQKLLMLDGTWHRDVLMRYQMTYRTCDGTPWTMDYPHLFGNSYYPIIVSHTPWWPNRTYGKSHTDIKISYLDHQSICRTAVINPWTVIQYQTLSGNFETWTVPGVAPVGASFQGFVIFNQ